MAMDAEKDARVLSAIVLAVGEFRNQVAGDALLEFLFKRESISSIGTARTFRTARSRRSGTQIEETLRKIQIARSYITMLIAASTTLLP